MAKRKKQKINITCRYCNTFFLSDREDERTALKNRNCNTLNKLVHIDTKICDNFIPAMRIWCDKNNYWMALEVCFSRIKNKVSGCVRCKQKKVINKIRRKYGN